MGVGSTAGIADGYSVVFVLILNDKAPASVRCPRGHWKHLTFLRPWKSVVLREE